MLSGSQVSFSTTCCMSVHFQATAQEISFPCSLWKNFPISSWMTGPHRSFLRELDNSIPVLQILASEYRNFSQVKLRRSIGTAPEFIDAVHKIGGVGKFPYPERIESRLERLNPSSARRICLTATEQLVNDNAMNFPCHAKFAESPGFEFVFQLCSHGLGNQDLRTEIFVQGLKARSEVRRISNHRI